MSSENKNNQPKAQGEQVQQRKQSRWRKGQHSVEPKKKDAEAIPILKYGPSNNFTKFKEVMSKAALKQYGDLGHLIRQGTYYIPPEPNRATYYERSRWTQKGDLTRSHETPSEETSQYGG